MGSKKMLGVAVAGFRCCTLHDELFEHGKRTPHWNRSDHGLHWRQRLQGPERLQGPGRRFPDRGRMSKGHQSFVMLCCGWSAFRDSRLLCVSMDSS